jgi:transposase InsO family protein
LSGPWRVPGSIGCRFRHRPRLLSDSRPCYVSGELRRFLESRRIEHTRGAPYHPMMQGKNLQVPLSQVVRGRAIMVQAPSTQASIAATQMPPSPRHPSPGCRVETRLHLSRSPSG